MVGDPSWGCTDPQDGQSLKPFYFRLQVSG